MNFSLPFEKIILFQTRTSFKGSDGSIMDFNPVGSKFSWGSSNMDKLGTYNFVRQLDQLYLETEFNYGRERTYRFTITRREGDLINAFSIVDNHHTEWKFYIQ